MAAPKIFPIKETESTLKKLMKSSSPMIAKRIVDRWLVEYNTERPHQALGFMTRVEFRQAA